MSGMLIVTASLGLPSRNALKAWNLRVRLFGGDRLPSVGLCNWVQGVIEPKCSISVPVSSPAKIESGAQQNPGFLSLDPGTKRIGTGT